MFKKTFLLLSLVILFLNRAVTRDFAGYVITGVF